MTQRTRKKIRRQRGTRSVGRGNAKKGRGKGSRMGHAAVKSKGGGERNFQHVVKYEPWRLDRIGCLFFTRGTPLADGRHAVVCHESHEGASRGDIPREIISTFHKAGVEVVVYHAAQCWLTEPTINGVHFDGPYQNPSEAA